MGFSDVAGAKGFDFECSNSNWLARSGIDQTFQRSVWIAGGGSGADVFEGDSQRPLFSLPNHPSFYYRLPLGFECDVSVGWVVQLGLSSEGCDSAEFPLVVRLS